MADNEHDKDLIDYKKEKEQATQENFRLLQQHKMTEKRWRSKFGLNTFTVIAWFLDSNTATTFLLQMVRVNLLCKILSGFGHA